ncbi:MAG TPA: hypothetical protein VK335_15850 [Bryobacteraceae bacterium]|nr:hypothetical protein [Bryobacteraceae bacterium]
MNSRLNVTTNVYRLASTCVACLILSLPPLWADDTQIARPQVLTPKPGALSISGKLPNDNHLVVITRTHPSGAQDQMLVQPDAKGNFTATVGPHDALQTGDKISAAAADSTVIGQPTNIQAGPPVVFVFNSADVTKLGSSWKPNLQVTVDIESTDQSMPNDWKGPHAGKVQSDTTLLQITDSLTAFPAAQANTFTVSLVTTSSNSDQITITTPLCDWGRVRCYAYFGGVFSGDFSKQNPYLDLDGEWNWIKAYWHPGSKTATAIGNQNPHGQTLLTGFFDVRLTQLPSSSVSTPPASPTNLPPSSSSITQSVKVQASGAAQTPTDNSSSQQAAAFASAKKSIDIEGGIYWAPYIPDHFIWNFQSDGYGLVPSVLLKGGGRGSLDGVVSQTQLSFPSQDKSFFTNYSGGTRLAFVKWHAAQGESHETLSYVDFTFGKDRLYDFVGATFPPGTAVQSGVRHYGLRKMVEGRLKIPKVDVQVGTDLNLGQGQNEVRLVVTTNAVSILKAALGVQ